MEEIKIQAMKLIFLLIFSCVLCSCRSDEEIVRLLKSSNKEDLIKGAYLAGENPDDKFIPLLLQNASDVRTSTNIKFKGYNVYQEKMIALKKILKHDSPVRLTDKPDSTIIKFYMKLANDN